MMEKIKVLYLCDKQACKTCHPDCTHTHDIFHAKNFDLVNHSFFEKRKEPFIIIQTQTMLKHEVMLRVRKEIEEMMTKGYILVDPSLEVIKSSCEGLTFYLSIKPEEGK